jgi:hypothetical protein
LGRGQIDYPYHALGYVDNENRTLYINNWTVFGHHSIILACK